MPYLSVIDNDSTKPRVTQRDLTPSGVKYKECVSVFGSPRHQSYAYSRSGTNSTRVKNESIDSAPGTYQLVAVQAPIGPRLSYRVMSKRLNKLVWARKRITVYKSVKVRSKIKPVKGQNLKPNALNYIESRVAYFGGDGRGEVNGWMGLNRLDSHFSQTFSGSLWAPFVPLRTTIAVGPNAQNYLTSDLSTRFTNAEVALSAKLLSKFYGAVKRQEVNYGQALVERAQTAGLVKDLAVRVSKAFSALRSGNVARAAKLVFPTSSKQLANDWLVYQYGIRPLCSDLQGAADLLTTDKPLVFDVKVRRREKLTKELISEVKQFSTYVPNHTKVYSEGFVDVTYKARIRVTAPLKRLATESGLSNLPTLYWESIPFSFVIDWLLPIGDYLNNQDAFANVKVEWATKTVFCKEYITFDRHLGGIANDYVFPQMRVGFINTRVKCVRTILKDIPPLPTPSFKDPVSAGHIANAIALLRQLKK